MQRGQEQREYGHIPFVLLTARGEDQSQNVTALFQHRLHNRGPAIGIDGRGGGGNTGAQGVVESLDALIVGEIIVGFAVVKNGQGNTENIVLAKLLGGKIAAGIGNNLIGAHNGYTPEIILDFRLAPRYNIGNAIKITSTSYYISCPLSRHRPCDPSHTG